MASFITAGNATNGLQVSSDNTGILELRTGTGSGTTAVTIGTGQQVAVGLGSASAPTFTFSGDTNTGIYSPGADTIAFTEGGVESMRLDSSGNLGLGVTPSAWGGTWRALEGSFGQSWFYSNTNTITGLVSNAHNNGTNWIYKTNNAAARYQLGANTGDHQWLVAGVGTAGTTATFTQAMTLDASGNLLVGTTSTVTSERLNVTQSTANVGLFVNVSVASSTANAAISCRKHDNNNTTAQIYLAFAYNQGALGAGGIQGNGSTGVQFFSSSDARLKENIAELEPQLANILALKPSKFDFIDGPKDCTGFIAQEMEVVYPDAVGEGEDGYKTIGGISIMETRLIKAIQELNAKIEAQAAEIAALKGAA